MKVYGLIGYPLTHSFSEKYFKEKFLLEGIDGCVYKNFPIQSIDMLPELLKENPGLCGLNVTIPYKEQVLKYLDALDVEAEKVGAVNTLAITLKPDLHIKGYNTDVYGFEESIMPHINQSIHQSALVLGTGGASKAIAYVLEKNDIQYTYISRTPSAKPGCISYNDLSTKDIENNKIIINTTPLGTYPNVEGLPEIPYEGITSGHLLYDLVYNPAETAFLKQGKKKGATCLNGLQMLHLQAEKAWNIWNVL